MSVVTRLRIVFYLGLAGLSAPTMSLLDSSRQGIWLTISATFLALLVLTTGVFLGLIARDATRSKRLERDDLTGLLNETSVVEKSELNGSGPGSVAVFDIDNFRSLNSTIGRGLGDEILREVARRIQLSLRPTDIAGRLGVDRFVVVLPGVNSGEMAAEVATRLLVEFFRPMEIGGLDLDVQASVGLAVLDDGAGTHAGIQRALVALDAARNAGRSLEIFRPEHEARVETSMEVISEVRKGIERGEFSVHLQPVIEAWNGRTLGFESLVRWMHPEKGDVPPGLFLSQIENLPVGRELSDFILEESLAALASLGNHRDLGLWVNVNPRDVEDLNLPLRIRQLLEKFGISARRLNIEVPETVSAQRRHRTEQVLMQIRDLGCGVAIDNFGRSSVPIDFLAALPVTELKIDSSLVSRCLEDSVARTVIRHCVGLAHATGLRVVAKGVERQAVMDCIVDLGCDAAQGFHFAHPMPVAELEQWLANDRVFS